MTRSPIFWVVVGVVGVWAWHHWVKPIPGAAT